MYQNRVMKRMVTVSLFIFLSSLFVLAQTKKYPSLLWEITGNGLQKPSYLFGTMHVSSKLVFHLSDSFYYAIKNVDEVALEQNPLYWQRDMMQMDKSQRLANTYLRNGANDYLNEKSFQPETYEDDIKAALTDEPQIVNGLLYRTYDQQEDYEENTYLDLYIYQTAKKLGKKSAGVEDYYQTERIVFEAYQDALKDKNKTSRSTNESAAEIEKKIQIAYRQGDLDALDSLEKFEYASPAFLEKFLYKRNEIQAHSIDTILKHNALFVGVGAAHLPGKRGVIELLRKMGYHLRPVDMQDRNAERKDEIDKLKVPVQFRTAQTDDGFVSMMLPGALYKRNSTGTRQQNNESWQYADMENGTYYTLIRVKTNAALLGENVRDVMRKTDSLLYENIPGKILSKTISYTDEYPVINITNRTRRGNLQRYRIIITPFEEVVCKMSGNDEYAGGEEADTFLNSIRVAHHAQQVQPYTSGSGGFTAAFPQVPFIHSTTASDGNQRMEWEAVDTTTGTAYSVWKETINNYRFLEEDTFDLGLIEESLKRSELISKELSRSLSVQDGYHVLNASFLFKNGSRLSTKSILRGAHYYLFMTLSKKKEESANSFLSACRLSPFQYADARPYTDTSGHFTVTTPVVPQLDSFLLKMINEASDMHNRYGGRRDRSSYANTNKTSFFQDDSTGEAVLVNSTTYPKYYYSKDSASFWDDVLDTSRYHSFIIKTKERYNAGDQSSGYKVILRDTNTVRQITLLYLLKKNTLFEVTAISDTVQEQSPFLRTFLASFRPDNTITGKPVFTNKQPLFFADYKSKDSVLHNEADEALADVKFDCDALPQLQNIITSFVYGDKNYFDNKSRVIHELGYIRDSGCVKTTETLLSQLYHQTADTAFFQNEILSSLARLKTAAAYDTLQALLLQDPPVFDDDNDYNNLFDLLYDSLLLTKRMFPNLIQLSSIETYKAPVNNLLQALVDSGYLRDTSYRTYFSRLFFDAKIAIKKMQNNDEKLLQDESNDDNDALSITRARYHYSYSSNNSNNHDELSTYSVLLMPFYDSVASVPLFFQKQLASKDPAVQLDAAIDLAKDKKPVPDSIWQSLAAKDKYRVQLLKRLEEINRKDLFPKSAGNQEAMAKSVLLNDKGEDKFQSLQLVNKELVTVNGAKGWVYFFKYKINKEDDWKIGISGLQPVNSKEISDDSQVTRMTDKNLTGDKPVAGQFEEQLKQLLFLLHASAYSFFLDNRGYDMSYYFGN